MSLFNKDKNMNNVQIEKKVVTGNELSEDELFNIAGGMSFTPEEEIQNEQLIRNMVDKNRI